MIADRPRGELYIYPGITGRTLGCLSPLYARIVTTGRSPMVLQLADVMGDWPFVGSVVYAGTESQPFRYILRVRSVTPGQSSIGVSENEITVPDSATRVYCPHIIPVLPKLQRVQDVGGTPTIWKDYDIGPQPLPPKVNVTGPFVSDGSPILLQVSWRNMEDGATGGTIRAEVPGGTATVTGTTVRVSFSRPGFRYVAISVQDSAGTGWFFHPVFVGVEPRPAFIEGCDLSASSGWVLTAKTHMEPSSPFIVEPIHVCVVRVGDLVWYGFVYDDEIDLDYRRRTVTLRIRSSVSVLERLVSHAFLLEDGARTSWTRVPSLTVTRAAHLLLEFHSTFNSVTPVVYDPVCDTRLKSNAFHEGSVLRQLNEDLLEDLLAVPSQQPSGLVTVLRAPSFIADRNAIRTVTMRPSEVSVSIGPSVGLVKAGGFAYDRPLLSRSPGTTPDIWSGTVERDGLIVSDQEDLNRIAGMVLARENAPRVMFRAFGPYDGFVPGTAAVRLAGEGTVVDVEHARVRHRSGVLIAEYDGRAISWFVPGETITVPEPPPPYVPDYPVPPEPEPPPFFGGTGLALVRARHVVLRTLNVYSYYPIWSVIFDARTADGNESSVVLDFRYVERRTGTYVVVMTTGGVYTCADVRADPTQWTRILTPSQVAAMVGGTGATLVSLCTLVGDPDYIGLTAMVSGYGWEGHGGATVFVFTTNWGRTWEYRVLHSDIGMWLRRPCSVLSVAGTSCIDVAASNGVVTYPTHIYRSMDKGRTWSRISETHGPTFPTFKSYRPWQYGATGQVVYAQLNVFGSPYYLAKSTRGWGEITDVFPHRASYWHAAHSFEVHTYDPNLVVCAFRHKSLNRVDFFRSTNGGTTWSGPVPVNDSVYGDFQISVRGNPANRDEWTVLDCASSIAPPDRPPNAVRLSQTLDGGQTWRSLMGNMYEIPELRVPAPGGQINYWTGLDYLILPPFAVVRRIE